jgi:cytochrome P450
MAGMATAPTDAVEKDYFTDHSVLLDPYDYFEDIRRNGAVYQMKSREDVIVVTGFQESVDILLNARDFSSSINPDPVAPLPYEVDGDDDISARIKEAQKHQPMVLMVSYDDDEHASARALLNPLFVPSRLKANEAFMRTYADAMMQEIVGGGTCELISKVATPFVTMVIADLLGVPADDRETFRALIDSAPPPGNMDGEDANAVHPLMVMGGYFMRYISERRAVPQDDVMTDLAQALYPDGTLPDVMEVVKSAMFLFAAGQDTSAKLIGNSIRHLSEDQALQQRLREDRSLIGPFLEEMLRLEGSTKATFRVVRRKTRIGDLEVPAGKRVVVSLSAANRDPRRWDDPAEFRIGRPRIKEHLAFGRGAHTCAGAPLARAEVTVLLDRLLEHTSSFALSEAHHGPKDARTVSYEPSYIIRGLANLHVDLIPR